MKVYSPAPKAPGDIEHGSCWLWLAAILGVAFALRLTVAIMLPNMIRPDEIYQNLEPAFRIWSGHGVVTWEWRDGIRSPIYPALLAGVIAIASEFGAGAGCYLAAIAATLSLLSIGTVAVGFALGRRHFGLGGAIICGLLCATWPELIYYAPKPLAEVQAGNLLVIAIYLASSADPGRDGAPPNPRRLAMQMFSVGFLLGLVFCIRFHLAPALLLAAVWTGRLQFRRRWRFLLLGGLLPIVALGVVDFLYWGSPFQSVWRNIAVNVGQGVSNEFGVEPAYFYGKLFLLIWGGAIIVLAPAFVAGFSRAPLFGATAILIVLSNTFIGHKEMPFVYAAVPQMLIVAGLGTAEIVRSLTRTHPGVRWTLAWAASAVWIAIALTVALGNFRPLWTAHRGALLAEAATRDDPQLCGLGVKWPAVLWDWTGGDVYLGRPVPLYAFGTAEGIRRVAPAINYAIGGRDVADGLPGFSVLRCWPQDLGDVCLARAKPDKTCIPDHGFDLNSVPGLGRPQTMFGADYP